MIVIAIIGVLASIAVPQYGNYTSRAKFSEVIRITATYKTAVSLCAQETNSIDSCTPSGSGSDTFAGIPPDITAPQGHLKTLTTVKGTITATATAELNDHDYILTPTYAANQGITWSVGGSCLNVNYCK